MLKFYLPLVFPINLLNGVDSTSPVLETQVLVLILLCLTKKNCSTICSSQSVAIFEQ